jgi:hypothetical protein
MAAAAMMAKTEVRLTNLRYRGGGSAPELKSRLLALRAAPQQMSHFCLTYGGADGLVGVVIMEAGSRLRARVNANAAVRSIAAGVPFAEGHAAIAG